MHRALCFGLGSSATVIACSCLHAWRLLKGGGGEYVQADAQQGPRFGSGGGGQGQPEARHRPPGRDDQGACTVHRFMRQAGVMGAAQSVTEHCFSTCRRNAGLVTCLSCPSNQP